MKILQGGKYMISVCIIVKNEEKLIEKCLKHLLPLEYEIVVVDTGSTDNTKAVAAKYTDMVFDYEWQQDFAAARNFAISKATNDYILMIDSDEILLSYDRKELEELIKLYPDRIGRIGIISEYVRGNEKYKVKSQVSRLFSKKLFCYRGSIHEQIVPINNNNGVPVTYNAPLLVNHSGYDGELEVRRKKTERNINLLLKELKDKGDDPYILYQLGKSYYMQEDYPAACEAFWKALYFDLDPKLEYVQDMVESYGYALLNSNQYETALQLLGVYDEFAVNADFVFLIGLIYMNNAMFTEAISEFLKAAKMTEYKMEGVNSYLAFFNIGVIHECLGNTEKAIKYYKKCGNYEKAQERLRNIR